MLVNEVTRKSEQISRSIEGFWVLAVLAGVFTIGSWLLVIVGTWDRLLFAVPLTLILIYSISSLIWLYRFKRNFEDAPSKFVRTQIREPAFIYLLTSFYHK